MQLLVETVQGTAWVCLTIVVIGIRTRANHLRIYKKKTAPSTRARGRPLAGIWGQAASPGQISAQCGRSRRGVARPAGCGGATETRALACMHACLHACPPSPWNRRHALRCAAPAIGEWCGDHYRPARAGVRAWVDAVDSAPRQPPAGGARGRGAPAHPAGRGRGTHTCRWIVGRARGGVRHATWATQVELWARRARGGGCLATRRPAGRALVTSLSLSSWLLPPPRAVFGWPVTPGRHFGR